MSALNQVNSTNFLKIINGKLVVQTSKELQVNSQLVEVSKKLDNLELNIIAAEKVDRKEYINQLKKLKISVQKLENLYLQLFCVMVIFGISSTFLLILLNYQIFTQKSQNKVSVINSSTNISV